MWLYTSASGTLIDIGLPIDLFRNDMEEDSDGYSPVGSESIDVLVCVLPPVSFFFLFASGL